MDGHRRSYYGRDRHWPFVKDGHGHLKLCPCNFLQVSYIGVALNFHYNMNTIPIQLV